MADTRDPNMMENGTFAHPDMDVARLNSKSTRRNRFVLLGTIGLAVVALTIGLSVGLTRNKENNTPTNSAATATGSTTMTTGSTTTGKASTTTSTASTNTGTASTTAPMDSTSTGTASTTTSAGSTSGTASTKSFTTSTGSLNVTLNLFNPNITIPYSDNDELKADLTEAVKLLVINIINSNKDQQQYNGYGYYYGGNYNGTGGYYYGGNYNGTDAYLYDSYYNGTGGYIYDGYYNGTDGSYYDSNGTMNYVMSQGGNAGPANSTTTSAGGGKAQFTTGGSSDIPVLSTSETTRTFRSNNQEANVDEADFVQSDGKFLYAAYGDVLLAWDIKSGKIVANITMPAIEYTPYNVMYSMTGEVITGGDNATGGTMNQNVSSDNAFNTYGDMYGYYYMPKAQIQSLLLTDNRLAVVISGYGGSSLQNASPNVKPKIMYEYLATRLQIYDTSALAISGGKLKLLNETDINGSFRDGRVVGSNVHLVTVASFDTYSSLSDPLYKWQPTFMNLTSDEYVVAAIKLAEEKLIPTFVNQLVEEMFANGKIDLARVSILQSQISNSTDMGQYMYGDGILNYLTQVVSFDLSATLSNNLALSLAGAFQSSSWGIIYATEEVMVVTANGYNWDFLVGGSYQTTYLLGFKLDGASSTPYAVGSIDGYLISQYSVDIHDGYMRLATTVQTELPYNESAPTEFFQNNGMLTQNFITILEIPSVVNDTLGELKVVGQSKSFGKDGEMFTSVRFFDDIAYCATFEVIDPFYVVNLTDPLNPKVVGELNNVTGFSSYLHPMNSANTVMLAVGQDANASSGMSSGLQLTVFDARNPIKPVTLQRYTVKTEQYGYSNSDAEWDFKAFQYLSLGDDSGVVIIPVTIIGTWNASSVGDGTNFDFMYFRGPILFDGFVIFDVNKTGITERIRISHVNSTDTSGCYSNANLPTRSFAYTGNIMTLKGHSVISTNLETGDQKWNLTLPTSEDPNGCMYMYR